MGWWQRLFGGGEREGAADAPTTATRSDVASARMRVEARLMAMHGVVSVGVGQDEEGTESIVVGVTGSDADVAAVPQDVDGVPIVVREIGAYRAEPLGDYEV